MGSCCNVADKAVESDLAVPTNVGTTGAAKGSYQHDYQGSGGTIELFITQQLEIFSAKNNNPVVLVSKELRYKDSNANHLL